MQRHVLTLIGPDRPGIIQSLADRVRELDGNWLASRMARLAGQFAGIVEFDLPGPRAGEVATLADSLRASGLAVTVQLGDAAAPATGPIWHIDLIGNDRPGIVREVTRAISACGGNVEEWESRVSSSPMSGSPMFEAQGSVRLSGQDGQESLRRALEALGADLSVDIRLTSGQSL